MAMTNLDASRLPDLGPVYGEKLWLAGNQTRMVKFLNELRNSGHDDAAICRALIDAVEHGRVQSSVLSVFFPWCKEPYQALKLCMAHESNTAIRSAAIKNFGKRIKKPSKQNNSTSLIQILGDTPSLLTLFAQSSVKDVKHLCVAISKTGRHGRQQQIAFNERQEAVERLLRALLPGVYPNEAVITCDKRPLQHLYAIMLPACSAKFVEAVLDARDQSNPLFRWRSSRHLMRSHRTLFKKRAEDHLFGLTSKADPEVHHYIGTLVENDRAFALSALHGRHDGTITNQRWGKHSEIAIAYSLVQHVVKRRHASKNSVAMQIRDLVQLGLEILERKRSTTSKKFSGNVAVELWTFALNGWRKWPEIFEDALVLGLRLGLGTSPDTVPRDYHSAATRTGFPEGRRPRLLQLYCLHGGNEGVDIFAEDASFAPLAKMLWPYEVFNHLDVEQSTRILKKLEAVNQDYNFLLSPSTKVSIFGLREVAGQKNFNVGLLLTYLGRDDPDVCQQAEEVVDGLRKKAAAARDQKARAVFAEAASAYAIATGDLDTYGDTILWQQRFVRDPLTARSIMGRVVVRNEEGLQLLSAVQTLKGPHRDVSSMKIRKADGILKTFYESYRLAKREPSFLPADWVHVQDLFGAVYERRFKHLETLCDTESNAVVWKGFLDATQWMDQVFLRNTYHPVMDLLGMLNPVPLATATQDLLRVGAERRKVQNRTPEDDLLERMSYGALKLLAKSSTPGLASDLVIQTIMDRPDASSWHRQLLSAGFLMRLPAKDAHDVLLSLARAISDKLAEQSYVRVGETEPAKHAPPDSLVKVTTVKYLAQLLNNADFITNETAVEVLVELFKNAQHRDIRLAALESLLSLLDRLCIEAKEGWAANPTVETIMSALETIMPVVGSINERRPPRDQDWADAEATGVLPEISDEKVPPLMEDLLSAAFSTRYPGLKVMRTAFIERLVLPILRQSQAEHRRWIRLFLAKYKAPFAEGDVPVTPVALFAWQNALTSHYPLVGSEILADFHAYAMYQILPDARMGQFSEALRADGQLSKRGEVQHWIQIFDTRVNSFAQSGTATLVSVLETRYDATSCVEYGPLVDMVLQHAKLFLDYYEEFAPVWDTFMTRIAPNCLIIRSAEKYRHWRDTHGRLARHISDEIGKRKARQTQGILPSGTKLELWLLPFRALHGDGDQCEFVVQLEDVLLGLLEVNETQVLGWSDMAHNVRAISGLIEGGELKASVAGEFGKLSDDKSMASRAGKSVREQTRRALDLIKVEVAMQLFDDCTEVKVIKDAGKERLKEWRACGTAGIRERVFRWEGKSRIEKA